MLHLILILLIIVTTTTLALLGVLPLHTTYNTPTKGYWNETSVNTELTVTSIKQPNRMLPNWNFVPIFTSVKQPLFVLNTGLTVLKHTSYSQNYPAKTKPTIFENVLTSWSKSIVYSKTDLYKDHIPARPPLYGEVRAKSMCFWESRRTTNEGMFTTCLRTLKRNIQT